MYGNYARCRSIHHSTEKVDDCNISVYRIHTSNELNGPHLLQVWQTFNAQTAEQVGSSSFEKNTSNMKVEKYQCPECSYTCAQPSNFTKHYRKHTGEKPFSCTECSYQTSDKSNLTRHFSIHSGEKRFSCPFCSFCSNRKYNLHVHVKTHK